MAKKNKGGPSTINGILYQMLYALFTVSKLRIDQIEKDKDINEIRLILEPMGGGGDQRIVRNNQYIVEQLKARTTNKPWSLKEIIESVLPDLYKAVDVNKSNCSYKFVTESQMGEWEDVLSFFKSLNAISIKDSERDVVSLLDENKKLLFRRKGNTDNTYWGKKEYTAKELFDFIVDKLSVKTRVLKEDITTVQKKLLHLLQNFYFIGGQTQEIISDKIDTYLSAIIPYNHQCSDIKSKLLSSLLEKACDGNACIDADDFFKEHGLNATSLRNTNNLILNSRTFLKNILKVKGYNSDNDVRPFSIQNLKVLKSDYDDRLVTILHGESGNGKSWNMYALADSIVRNNEGVIVYIDAKGDCEKDLNNLAAKFNEHIWGHDSGPSLNRIAERFKDLNISKNIWCFVDNIQDPKEAYDLICQQWEVWGFRLVISCQEHIYSNLNSLSDKYDDIEVKPYSLDELTVYLKNQANIKWHQVPADIRDVIHKPLLAHIFCKLPNPLHAESEYSLYDSFWKKIGSDSHHFDSVGIQKLAFSLLNNVTYPWTKQQLIEADIDTSQCERLIRVGWLRHTCDGRYEVSHLRLLNWAIAEGIVNAYYNREITEKEITEQFNEIIVKYKTYSGQCVGYIPMDIIWIASVRNDNPSLTRTLLQNISSIYRVSETIYPHLLPTIGSKIILYMFDELIRLINEDADNMIIHYLIDGLILFQPDELKQQLIKMLSSECKLQQRYAAEIIKKCPLAIYLDILWILHCNATEKPEDYFQYKNDSEHSVYGDTFDALLACVIGHPTWIEEKVRTAPSKEPISDLAYLLANLDDGKDIWSKCKRSFFNKIPPNKERAIATNINKWKDSEEIQWCIDRLRIKEDLLGSSALSALSAISPEDAIPYMEKVPNDILYFTRFSAPKDLLIQRPELANMQLLNILKNSENPLWSSLIYQGNELLMSEEVFDYILDKLEEYIKQLLLPVPENKKINLYPVLTMLSKTNSLPLLKCLQKRKNGSLENNLKIWLSSIGPRKFMCTDSLEREPALNILYKMGGNAFIEVVNEYLIVGNR